MGALCCTSLKTGERENGVGAAAAAANSSRKGYKGGPRPTTTRPTAQHTTLCDAIFDSVAFMCPCASGSGRNGGAAKHIVELDIMRNTWKNPPHEKPNKRAGGTTTPHAHRPIDIVQHEMLPCNEADGVDAFARPHTWPKERPRGHAPMQMALKRPPPLCGKNIFINIDTLDDARPCSGGNNTPSDSSGITEDDGEEWHTPRTLPCSCSGSGSGPGAASRRLPSPRTADATYCRVRRDSNENTFTFTVDSSVVKDVYINYERMRSLSL